MTPESGAAVPPHSPTGCRFRFRSKVKPLRPRGPSLTFDLHLQPVGLWSRPPLTPPALERRNLTLTPRRLRKQRGEDEGQQAEARPDGEVHSGSSRREDTPGGEETRGEDERKEEGGGEGGEEKGRKEVSQVRKEVEEFILL
ncbi:hypothetical protein EYF80_054979 [Liparis tanakae]|uniref:Uncharacterized protein n=1 Tax=Liparis tanakae TaxID=230148 RepID=A0A4Z2F0X4_9TELE|nr:hypothetical protein EYF80_054979 [Liparis tanakae]